MVNKKDLIEFYLKKKSISDVSKKFCVSKSYVRKILDDIGLRERKKEEKDKLKEFVKKRVEQEDEDFKDIKFLFLSCIKKRLKEAVNSTNISMRLTQGEITAIANVVKYFEEDFKLLKKDEKTVEDMRELFGILESEKPTKKTAKKSKVQI